MYEDKTYENIRDEILSKVTLTDTREGSFASDVVSPISYEMEKTYNQFDRMLGIMFLDTSAGTYIDDRGKEYGIIRKEGTYAKGEVTFTGEKDVEIPAGTLCATVGGLMFEVLEGGVIPEGGTITLPVEAQEPGDKYNVLAGSVRVLPTSIFGVTAVTNGGKMLGGSERETDAELVERILLKLQSPATSGNVYHYKLWAMNVEGVGNVKVFPLDNGPGTVTVMPITSSGRSPDEEIIQRVKEYIEEQRPIGATVTVMAPAEKMINIAASVEITTAVTAETVKEAYGKMLEEYIKSSVFKLSTVDYFKCLSMFYDIEGVVSVKTFTINGGTESISIGEKEIQVTGSIDIEGAVG